MCHIKVITMCAVLHYYCLPLLQYATLWNTLKTVDGIQMNSLTPELVDLFASLFGFEILDAVVLELPLV